MKKLIAALVVLSASASFARPPYGGWHHPHPHNGAGDAAAVGIVAGLLAGTLSIATTADAANQPQYKQIILDAQDDAAVFVMSEGADGRTAKLTKAFDLVRKQDAALQASDLELAQAILDAQ